MADYPNYGQQAPSNLGQPNSNPAWWRQTTKGLESVPQTETVKQADFSSKAGAGPRNEQR
jgi:hypothetical protein